MRRVAIVLLLVIVPVPVAAQVGSVWVQTGLEWHPLPPPGGIDEERVAEQIAVGCGASGIHFGDTAGMRGFDVPDDWPDDVREFASRAAFTDSEDDALEALRQALATPGLTGLQRLLLENQQIHVALQFGDRETARTLLAAHGMSEALPGPIRSDRLFWSAMVNQPGASPREWRDTLLPRLDQAFAADPTSFQVRVWRAIGWLEGAAWTGGDDCTTLIREFSTRVLDVSQASACPLMIGHVAHAMDRHFDVRSEDAPISTLATWRKFATGLLAILSGERATAAAMRLALAESASQIACAAEMSSEIRRVGEAR